MNLLTKAALCAVLSLSFVSFAAAQQPAQQPPQLPANAAVIHVEKMCCDGCAQKIAAQLYVLRGVKEVRADWKKKVVIVIPQNQARLSPRAIWEAVEKGQDRPVRLACPVGTFTAKPRF